MEFGISLFSKLLTNLILHI